MQAHAPAGPAHSAQVRDIFARIAADLTTLTDRPFVIEGADVRHSPHKIAGADAVHIAFKLGFSIRGQQGHGALLMPLTEAISIVGTMWGISADRLAELRLRNDLDAGAKDAMLELAGFVGGAVDGALRVHLPEGVSVRSEGCQGLRPGHAPSFGQAACDAWIAAWAPARFADFPSFRLALLLPSLPAE